MKELISHNPATQEVIWKGNSATPEQIDRAIEKGRTAFENWSSLPIEKRIDHLETYAHNLTERKESIAEKISQETGKPLWEALQEVGAMIQKVPISIAAYSERCPTKVEREIHITHRPHGVVAVFGPFNFPGHLPNGHIVPALLAGNTVIFKGSSQTPTVSEALVACWELPDGVLTLLHGGGEQIAHHPQIDGIFFTGSFQVGNLLSQIPHKILALEMGGNNPLIIADCKERVAASNLILQSAFLTAGQRCTCARRLILLEKEESLLDTLLPMVEKIVVGPYTQRPEPFMGPVISLKAAEKLLDAQDSLIARGASPLLPMKRLEKHLPFLTPGILDVTNVPNRSDEEYFGPLLQLIRVPTFEAALKQANATHYGLSAGLVSEDPHLFDIFFHTIRAGVINWNRPTTGASSRAPFGGVGQSGNFHPSGYYAADYCSYPVVSMQSERLNS